jgi:BirA family transcriptional regulator, biotin operon repressor / biotin---[acetyl-CoA-carboxylase] ligase
VGALLQARGQAWPAPIEYLERVTSTSDVARDRARAGAPAWSVFLAGAQSAGRGRQGHGWISPPGNLFLSVLLRPEGGGAQAGLIPLAAGVAVSEALETFGVRARLKWPNDLMVGDRKIAGLLAEAASGAEGIESVILGVGINLTLDPADAPPWIRQALTSVSLESRRTVSPAEAAAETLARMAVWYHALAREGAATVLAAWRARSVPWWGRPIEVRSAQGVVRGVARGVDERGALLIDLPGGTRAALLSGEARELRLAGE